MTSTSDSGDIQAAPAGKAPSFLVYAMRDPMGANLDLPKEIPLEQQERAYTSPIWYNP